MPKGWKLPEEASDGGFDPNEIENAARELVDSFYADSPHAIEAMQKEAQASLRRAVALRESLTDWFPEDPLAALHLAVARAALGGFLRKKGSNGSSDTRQSSFSG